MRTIRFFVGVVKRENVEEDLEVLRLILADMGVSVCKIEAEGVKPGRHVLVLIG